jgi:hypothetical protein
MWSQVFVVQPADFMSAAVSCMFAGVVPAARAEWPCAGVWPAAARAVPGPKVTPAAAAPVKTIAARIVFREVVVLVVVFMN